MSNRSIYVVGLEKIESRYTIEWYDYIPNLLEKTVSNTNSSTSIVNVEGFEVDSQQSLNGAFLDFAGTNIWKSSQLEAIAHEFRKGNVQPNSIFLYTDAWNPSVLQLRYMSELYNIPILIYGMWHAGSYDPQDFLGRLIGQKSWIRYTELAMFHAYDINWFATVYHSDIFIESVRQLQPFYNFYNKIQYTGWPMSYLKDRFQDIDLDKKTNTIVFPHRLAPEKQVDIFKDLAISMPEYNWIICQEKKLTKSEYHDILKSSKIVFSASLQETLGISTCAESTLSYNIPLAPDRLSYSEIFKDYDDFLYSSDWTANYQNYLTYKQNIISLIKNTINNYNNLLPTVTDYNNKQLDKFFDCKNLLSCINKNLS